MKLPTQPPGIDFSRYVAERTHDFAGRAWLFQALDASQGETRETMRAEAIGLLRRAAGATEGVLAFCGMTSHELRESAHELETETKPQTMADTIHEQENPE